MANASTSPVLTTRFGNLDTFCEELAERGPNVEPIVRICQQVRSGQSDTHGRVHSRDHHAEGDDRRRCRVPSRRGPRFRPGNHVTRR